MVCVIPQFNYSVNGTGVINANLPSQFSNPSNTNIMLIPVSLNIDGKPLVGQIMFVIGIAQLTFYADTNMGQLTVSNSIGTYGCLSLIYNLQ